MIITFAGHSKMSVSRELREQIKHLLVKQCQTAERVICYCGGYGAFDLACAQMIKETKTEFPQIRSIDVTPYLQDRRLQDAIESGLYDETLYPSLEQVPYRFAISKRNAFLAEQADLVICYVTTTYGGAYQTMTRAKRQQKRVINLAEE